MFFSSERATCSLPANDDGFERSVPSSHGKARSSALGSRRKSFLLGHRCFVASQEKTPSHVLCSTASCRASDAFLATPHEECAVGRRTGKLSSATQAVPYRYQKRRRPAIARPMLPCRASSLRKPNTNRTSGFTRGFMAKPRKRLYQERQAANGETSRGAKI